MGWVSVCLYDFGVVVFVVWVVVEDVVWNIFVVCFNVFDRVLGLLVFDVFWVEMCVCLCVVIVLVLDWLLLDVLLQEDYLFGIVWLFSELFEVSVLSEWVDLVVLFFGEMCKLFDVVCWDLLVYSYFYYVDDLVFFMWDWVFIYELCGDLDVVDVIEVVNV